MCDLFVPNGREGTNYLILPSNSMPKSDCITRPLKNGNLCSSSSRRSLILSGGRRSASDQAPQYDLPGLRGSKLNISNQFRDKTVSYHITKVRLSCFLPKYYLQNCSYTKFDKPESDDSNYSAISAQNIMAHLLLLFIMKSS